MAFSPTAICYLAIVWILLTSNFARSFRLNVPRVLLPYHPENQVQYTLEVTHPEGGCFTWRSSRTDIVSVEVLHPKRSGCSDKAIITSRSRHSNQQSAVIFAEDHNSGVLLSCDVTVDIIHSIAITTTTKVLFVDAVPALLVIEAMNREGDRFSTLGNIPFDWYFTFNEGRPLHIVPFSESKYDSPPGIEELEQKKNKGYVVLVEGVSTGSAQLSAKFFEKHFVHIPSSSIDLFVLANVMLVPSSDLYLPIHSIVKYSAMVLRKGRSESVPLPSSQYQLQITDESICHIDIGKSLVIAKSIGSTEIILVDSYMKSKTDIKPRSAQIFIVEPDAVQFTIDQGNNWYLQLDVEYQIFVKLTDQHGNFIHIPDNAVFKTAIAETYFNILEKSKNGTYFRVKTKRTGKLNIKSSFSSVIDMEGKTINVHPVVSGEQQLEILTPLKISPDTLIFPYHSTYQYQYLLKASGGSGNYYWQSSESIIAQVGETTGLVTSGKLGEIVITAKDAYNNMNRATAKVLITEPYELRFGPSHVEAEIGTRLTLNLLLLGQTAAGLKPFTDCRHADFDFHVTDSHIFMVDEGIPPAISNDEGCSTITLRALSEGDTTLIVSFNRYNAVIHVSAYPPLKINVFPDLLLTLGAGVSVSFDGGPHPWILDGEKYSIDVSVDQNDVASAHVENNKMFKVFCHDKVTDTFVKLSVTNQKSLENPLPAVSSGKVHVCCANPSTLTLIPQRSTKNDLPACPAFSHSIYFNAPITLELSALGHCPSDTELEERPFDSIGSLVVEYKAINDKIRVDALPVDLDSGNKLYSLATPQGVAGSVVIEAVVSHFYDHGSETPSQKIPFADAQFSASLSLKLVDFARADIPSLLLWNDKSVKGVVKINGGSGHFWMDNETSTNKISSVLRGNTKDSESELEIIPKSEGFSRITLHDMCIEDSKLDIDVKVTDIKGIHIDSPSFVPSNSAIDLKIAILDIDGKPFSRDDINDIQIILSPVGSHEDSSELILKNLITKQVVRFPVNLKLSSEVQQENVADPTFDGERSSIPPEYYNAVSTYFATSYITTIREIFAAFFEGYHSFVLSTFVLLVSVLTLSAAYRYGYLYPIVGTPPQNTKGIKSSPIQQVHPFGFRSKGFPERPIFHSTPADASNLSGIEGITPRVASPQRRSLLDEHNLMNYSRRSAGSDDDPYLWTTNDASPMHNGSLINRHYK